MAWSEDSGATGTGRWGAASGQRPSWRAGRHGWEKDPCEGYLRVKNEGGARVPVGPGNQAWEMRPPQEHLGAPWGVGVRQPPPPLCSTGPPARPCASPRHLPGCPEAPDRAAGTPGGAGPSARMRGLLPAGPGQTPPELGIQDARAREGVAFVRPRNWGFRTACAREAVASNLAFLLFSAPPVKSLLSAAVASGAIKGERLRIAQCDAALGASPRRQALRL